MVRKLRMYFRKIFDKIWKYLYKFWNKKNFEKFPKILEYMEIVKNNGKTSKYLILQK